MTPFGVILLIFGGVLALAGVFFDPSVAAPGAYTGRTINFGLQQDRLILVVCGLGIAVVGAIFAVGGMLLSALQGFGGAIARPAPAPPPAPALPSARDDASDAPGVRTPLAVGDEVVREGRGTGVVEALDGPMAEVRFGTDPPIKIARALLRQATRRQRPG